MNNTTNSLQVAYKIAEDEFLERIKYHVMSVAKIKHHWDYHDSPDTYEKNVVGFTIGPSVEETCTFVLWIYHSDGNSYPCVKYYKNNKMVKNLRYNMNICISDIIADIMKIIAENSAKSS